MKNVAVAKTDFMTGTFIGLRRVVKIAPRFNPTPSIAFTPVEHALDRHEGGGADRFGDIDLW